MWLSGDKEGAVLAVPDEYSTKWPHRPSEEYENASLNLFQMGQQDSIIRTTDTSTIELISEITESNTGLNDHDHSQVEAQTKVI